MWCGTEARLPTYTMTTAVSPRPRHDSERWRPHNGQAFLWCDRGERGVMGHTIIHVLRSLLLLSFLMLEARGCSTHPSRYFGFWGFSMPHISRQPPLCSPSILCPSRKFKTGLGALLGCVNLRTDIPIIRQPRIQPGAQHVVRGKARKHRGKAAGLFQQKPAHGDTDKSG